MVTWVYDGDTVAVDGDNGTIDVRFLGINAPEGDECFYDRALDRLIETLKGRTVTLDVEANLDQYGRTLAYVWDGDRAVNLEMVQMGLAIATTPDSGIGFIPEEEKAYLNGVGLWSNDACASSAIPNVVIDAVDSAGEIVIIVNDDSSAIDISGWTLRDESSRHRYRIPTGRILQPDEQMAISSDDPTWDPGGSPVWNNDGDMALLLDRDGRVVDRWRY